MNQLSKILIVSFSFMSILAFNTSENLNNYDRQLKKFLINKAPAILQQVNKNSKICDSLSEPEYSTLEPIRFLIVCYNDECKYPDNKIVPIFVKLVKENAKRLGVKLSID